MGQATPAEVRTSTWKVHVHAHGSLHDEASERAAQSPDQAHGMSGTWLVQASEAACGFVASPKSVHHGTAMVAAQLYQLLHRLPQS